MKPLDVLGDALQIALLVGTAVGAGALVGRMRTARRPRPPKRLCAFFLEDLLPPHGFPTDAAVEPPSPADARILPRPGD